MGELITLQVLKNVEKKNEMKLLGSILIDPNST